MARRAMNEAAKYAKERETMGQAIIQHQAIAFMLADMAAGIEASRLLTLKVPCPVATVVPCDHDLLSGALSCG